MARKHIDFGIDLGTTNSTIAVIDAAGPKVITHQGSVTTASAVWIDKRSNLHVGDEARKRASYDVRNAYAEFKQMMGTRHAFRFTDANRDMSPEELSAEVLKSLKRDVHSELSEDVAAAVITTPAAFETPANQATLAAARMAGFRISPLLQEPIAAALAYGFRTESEKVYWQVFDLGGGTFDAAVVRVRDGLVQVVAHEGDNRLGGKLIDWEVVEKLLIPAAESQLGLTGINRRAVPWFESVARLKHAAEEAKIKVCRTREPAEIWIENFGAEGGKTVDFLYSLTPAELESLSQPFIERALNLCAKALQHRELQGGDMERILMVGGSTLSPWVRDAVKARFGDRLDFSIDPVTAVASGAAIFAGIQRLPEDFAPRAPVAAGSWTIKIEHEPIGNVSDPDVAGRVTAPGGLSVAGATVEFVDKKTGWRSGRIALSPDGVFITQLHAEKHRRCDYAIELCDASGARVPADQDEVSYWLGTKPPEKPPATMTVGVGQANGAVLTYIKKGEPLPAKRMFDHVTTESLRAGAAEDMVRVVFIEGEHARAERNHYLGELVIRGTDIRRDLNAGTQLEITARMDASQEMSVQVYVPALDEEFDAKFSTEMQHDPVDQMRQDVADQRDRLDTARQKLNGSGDPKAKAALAQINDQKMLEQIDNLAERADGDPEAALHLDRKVRELAAAIDDIESSLNWPAQIADAQNAREAAQQLVENHGTAEERTRLAALLGDLEEALKSKDPERVRRAVNDVDVLYFTVADRLPGFHIQNLDRLKERRSEMVDKERADQIIAQADRAIKNQDIEGIKAAVRQLAALLPRGAAMASGHRNRGNTMAQG